MLRFINRLLDAVYTFVYKVIGLPMSYVLLCGLRKGGKFNHRYEDQETASPKGSPENTDRQAHGKA